MSDAAYGRLDVAIDTGELRCSPRTVANRAPLRLQQLDTAKRAHTGDVPDLELQRRNSEPWESDPMAQALVAEFGAMSPASIAAYLGMSRQMVGHIEKRAMRRLTKDVQRALRELYDAYP